MSLTLPLFCLSLTGSGQCRRLKVKQEVTIDMNLKVNSYQKLQVSNVCTMATLYKGCVEPLMCAS